MKKIITTAVATGLLLGTSANAVAAPVIDRDAATVSDAEGIGEGGSLLIVLIVAALIAAGIVLIENNEDPDNLPTSP
ncbi:hypothetical protein [Erythrobacter alti]|uniref:hypothetical protein n=1 Tax=Erythrobacter alti TaxID=1896145 RepID=UPI0030F42EB7